MNKRKERILSAYLLRVSQDELPRHLGVVEAQAVIYFVKWSNNHFFAVKSVFYFSPRALTKCRVELFRE